MAYELKELSAGYGRAEILHQINMKISPGEIITITGMNGSGKSTLLKLLARQISPRHGEVYFNGAPLKTLSRLELARKVAVLGQFHHAPGELSVRELVDFGRFPRRRWALPSAHDRAVVDTALANTGATDLADRRLRTLSGGERQRAWLAMALAQEPEVLLLDEPTTFLDLRCQLEISELIRELNARLGVTVVMVLHDLNLAANISHRIAALKAGRIVACDTPKKLITPDSMREIFGVEAEILALANGAAVCAPIGAAKI